MTKAAWGMFWGVLLGGLLSYLIAHLYHSSVTAERGIRFDYVWWPFVEIGIPLGFIIGGLVSALIFDKPSDTQPTDAATIEKNAEAKRRLQKQRRSEGCGCGCLFLLAEFFLFAYVIGASDSSLYHQMPPSLSQLYMINYYGLPILYLLCWIIYSHYGRRGEREGT